MKDTQGTKLTTVRIPKNIYEIIQADAQSEGVSFNAVVTRILRRHVEWERVFGNIGLVSVPRDLAIEFLDSVDKKEIERISRIQITKQIIEMSEFLESGPDKWLNILNLFCKYGGLGSLQIKENGSELAIHLRHGLGPVASKMLASVLDSLSSQSGYRPKIEAAENSLSVTLADGRIDLNSKGKLLQMVGEIERQGLKFRPSLKMRGKSEVYHRVGGTLEDSGGRVILIDFPETGIVTEREVMGLYVKMLDLKNIGGIIVGEASEKKVKQLADMYNVLIFSEYEKLMPSFLALFAKNRQG